MKISKGVKNAMQKDGNFATFVCESLLSFLYTDWGDCPAALKRYNDNAMSEDRPENEARSVIGMYEYGDLLLWIVHNDVEVSQGSLAADAGNIIIMLLDEAHVDLASEIYCRSCYSPLKAENKEN